MFQAWQPNGFKSGDSGDPGDHSADLTNSKVPSPETCKSHGMSDGHSVTPSWRRALLQAHDPHDPLSCQFQKVSPGAFA
jgi:hypothetical protein